MRKVEHRRWKQDRPEPGPWELLGLLVVSLLVTVPVALLIAHRLLR